MKVGIAIPCQVDDRKWLPTCLQAINNLDPAPYTYLVDLNRGDGSLDALKRVRTRLFDELFEKGCDVIVSADVDFCLFPNILHKVEPDRVVSFCYLQRRLIDIVHVIIRRLTPNPWSGCYSLPRQIWESIKDNGIWDGSDSSVAYSVGRANYKFVHSPQYFLVRRSPRTIQFALSKKGILHKIKWLALHSW